MKINRTPFVYAALCALLPILAGCPASKPDAADAPYGQAAPPAAPPAQAPPPPSLPSGSLPTVGKDVPPGPATGEPGAGNVAPMMGGGDLMAPLTLTPALDAAIKTASAKADKKAIAAAYTKRGYARMTDDAAGQRIKYRAALDDFRAALQNDPTNKQATQYKATIEEIYTSMGRPVPGTEPPGPAR